MADVQVYLYVINGDSQSERAKALLKGRGISFVQVDLVKSGALAFIERDFGVTDAPFIVTPQSTIEGLARISRFASAAA